MDEISTAEHGEADAATEDEPTYIFIGQLMGEAYTLRLVLDRLAVNNSSLEVLQNAPMDRVTLSDGLVSARLLRSRS